MKDLDKGKGKKGFPGLCIVNDERTDFELFNDRAELPFLGGENYPHSVIQKLTKIKIDNKPFPIAIPNFISLYIGTAQKEHYLAFDLIINFNNSQLAANDVYGNIKKNTEEIFNYLSHKSNSLINSFQALESYCNLAIPDSFEYKKVSKSKTEIFSKKQIERHINIEEKLNKILCNVYDLKPISSTKIWEIFKIMSLLRNELIHLKTHKTNNIMEILVSSYKINFADISKTIIQYYVDGVFSKSKDEMERFDLNELKRWPQFQNIKVLFGTGTNIEMTDYSGLLK